MKHNQEEYWNELAKMLERMDAENGELLKYTSVLSAEKPETMQDALHLAQNLNSYERMQHQQVCDALEITLYGSGIEDQSLSYHLNAAEKEVLREKMEAYCMQRERKPLNQLCQEILQDLDTPAQAMQI